MAKKTTKANPARYRELFDYAPDTHFVLLDLAHWERDVDFKQLATDGVKAIVLKGPAGVGWDDVDASSYKRAPEVLDAGLFLSFYQFNYPSPEGNDAHREAEFFFEFLKKISRVCGVPKCWHFSPWADMEINSHGFSPRRLTDWLLEHDERMRVLTGEQETLYCFRSYLENELVSEDLQHMPLAVARYPKGGLKPGMTVGGKGVADRWNDGAGADVIQWTSSAGDPAVNGGRDAFDGCVARMDSPVFRDLLAPTHRPPSACYPDDRTTLMVDIVTSLDASIAGLVATRTKALESIST